MTPRQRILDILCGREADRPAVLCPGGMMSCAVTEVMTSAKASWPQAHTDEIAMARLGLSMQEATGFDNIALPFCMTVEAESYGAKVDLGNPTTQPRVKETVLAADLSSELPRPDFEKGRAARLLDALGRTRSKRPDLALIGNLVGPFSLLAMLADPLKVLRLTRTQPQRVSKLLDTITDDLIEFGTLQREVGADVICIAEPTATGEILGARLFAASAAPHLNRLAKALSLTGAKVIVHICGDVRRIERELFELQVDALSFDSMVNICSLRKKNPPWRVMGNVDCFLLHDRSEQAIRRACERLVRCGVRLISPACGVIPTTTVSRLRAMREAVS